MCVCVYLCVLRERMHTCGRGCRQAIMSLFQYVHTTCMENIATLRVTRSVPNMLLVIITEERLFRQVSHISSCFYGLF